MALGSLTPVKGASYRVSNKRCRVYDVQVTSGANYTAGGETINATDVGLRSRIDQVIVLSNPRSASGAISSLGINYGSAGVFPNSVKVQAYFSANAAPDAEVAAGTDLSTYSARVVFIGA